MDIHIAAPVNGHATPEAKHLSDFLSALQGRYTLAGQHNYPAVGSKYTDTVYEITGKHPIIWGSDFSFCYQGTEPEKFQHCGPLNLPDPSDPPAILDVSMPAIRQAMVDHAIRKYREGYIITLMWHAGPPNLGDCCDGRAIWTLERRPSQAYWDELTTPGTPLQLAWKQQADTIAGYLRQFADAHIPVLWRPYHEMNGVWFWWCNKPGAQGFVKLWRMLYTYFVHEHRLDNLLWVWNTNAPRDTPNDEAFAYADFWPGHDVVDVLAADVYRKDWKPSHHDELRALANGKPMALGEVGELPTPDILRQQPQWTWFMTWGNIVVTRNTAAEVNALYHSERVLCKEDITRDADGVYRIRQQTVGGQCYCVL